MDFIRELFNAEIFMPHGHCYFWKPGVVFLHVFSDFLIGTAYYSIPMVLYHFAHKRSDLPYRSMFIMFSIFIFACGTTHFMNIVTVWKPVYWLDGIVKLLTAIASITTALCLFPLIPKALTLRSPAELELANLNLEKTVDELQKTQIELKRSNADLEQFAYVASHDLQEPVRMMAAFSELLSNNCRSKLDNQSKEHLDMVLKSSQKMHHLVNDLLAYAKTGKTINFEEIDCANVLQEVLTNLKGLIDETQTVVHCDSKLPKMTADPVQISQLFQNLIANGIKFQKKPAKPIITIFAEETPLAWSFTIKDNGIGIKSEYKERIFQIFQRLHTASEFPGTGIGLALCKKIVEHHGGNITVESEPDNGSRFIFTISKNLKTETATV